MRRADNNVADRISVSPKKKSPARLARDARRDAQYTTNRIHETARERQETWAEGEGKRANETARLTRELDELYGHLRAATTGKGAPYAGRTTAPFAQPPKPALASAPGKWPTHRTRNDERPVATPGARESSDAEWGDDRSRTG